MKKNSSNIAKKEKGKNKAKKGKNQFESTNKHKNNLSKCHNSIPSDTIQDIAEEEKYNNISNNENNVIAKILEANKIKKDSPKNGFFDKNQKMKNKKLSKELLLYNEYKQIGDFSFINISKVVAPFLYRPKQTNEYASHAFNNFKFLDMMNSYRMIINILVDDDSLKSSINLSKIFESIILSLDSLNEIKINNRDFLVCIFFQNFSNEHTFKELFPGLDYYICNNINLNPNDFYCSYGYVLSMNDTPINTLIFYKQSSTFVEICKFFYCNILSELITLINLDAKEIGKTFLVVNWPLGKIYQISSNKYHKSRILANIFRITNNRNMILIPEINYFPNNDNDTFGHINKYNFDSDKVEVNLYWDVICGYPIDHRFFFVNMNYNLYLIFKEYYQNKIDIYSNEYYHDYNLTIYLRDNSKDLVIQKIQQVKIQYNHLPYSLIDFFFDYNLRKGSEFANYFNLIPYFVSLKNMTFFKFVQKFFLFFKLLMLIFQFFWLGLSFLIIYAVFNDTFGSKDSKMDYFSSLGYIIIIISLLFKSLLFIKNKPRIKKNIILRKIKRNANGYAGVTVFYFFHYLYFCFFIICAIIAIIHIDQGKKQEKTDIDYYEFKSSLCIVLLIINIGTYILPSFLRPSNLISKGFLYYILFQFPNSVTFFFIPYIFTCTRNVSSKGKKLESLYISMYIILNGMLTVICLVFDTTRKRRMDFMVIIVFLYTILSGMKLITLIIGFCSQNKFNKYISTGDIPQYNISSEESNNMNNINANSFNNNIYINNNIKNINISMGNNINKKLLNSNNNTNNEDFNPKSINKGMNSEEKSLSFEKKNSSQLEFYLNKKNIFPLNTNFNANDNDFVNVDNKSSFSHVVYMKNNPMKEFEKNYLQEKNNLKKSANYESSFSLPNIENTQEINNANTIYNKDNIYKFYPMDTEEKTVGDKKDNDNKSDLNYSNRKSNNYPMDNIEPFSLKKNI